MSMSLSIIDQQQRTINIGDGRGASCNENTYQLWIYFDIRLWQRQSTPSKGSGHEGWLYLIKKLSPIIYWKIPAFILTR